MDWIRLTDFVFLTLTTVALGHAIVRGYFAASHPLLWFAIGTGIFLHVGSINDHFRGTSFAVGDERGFRVLELFHISMVAVGYLLTARAPMGINRGESSPLSSLRFLLAVPIVLFLKMLLSNPFERFDPELSNYARVPAQLAVATGCLAIAYYDGHATRLRGAQRALMALFALSILLVCCFFRSRTPMMYALSGVFLYVLWVARERSIRTRWLRRLIVLGLPVIAVTAVAIGASLKGFASTVTRDVEYEQAEEFALQHGTQLGFIDAYQNGIFAYATHPRPFRFRDAESVLSIVLGPIPRSLWPDKPFGYAYYFTAERVGVGARDAGLSLSMSLLGDLWANGGWPSVLLTSLGFGLLMGLMRNWGTRRLSSVRHQIVYWQFLFMCLLSARGDLYTIWQRGMVFMVFTASVSWVLASPTRRRDPTPLTNDSRPLRVASLPGRSRNV